MHIPGYKIEKELGRGAMATVYLAVQKNLDRLVALKVMSPALLADPSFGSRFLREAKIVAQLSHPHVIPIYDVSTNGDYYYIAMEYQAGGELKAKIKSGLSLHEAVNIIKEMAYALNFAHDKGYIHRDVKPANILFNSHGKSLLTDFGVARAHNSSTKITAVGTVIGTPLYMSPEQVQGKQIDHRSDLYSLGAVFYEAIIGKPPYQGDSAVTIAVKHMTEAVPLLPEKYHKFQAFFEKILNKDPAVRFQSGTEIILALDQIDLDADAIPLNGTKRPIANDNTPETPTVLGPKPAVISTPTPSRRNNINQPAKSIVKLGLVGTVLAGVLASAGFIYFNPQTPTIPSIHPAQNPITGNPAISSDTILDTTKLDTTSPDKKTQTTVPQIADKPQNPLPAIVQATPSSEQQHTSDLLLSASVDMAEKRFVKPSNNNAYQKYLAILKIDQNNAQAKTGIRTISDHYIVQAESALKTNQFKQARQYYDQAQQVYAQNPALQALNEKINLAKVQYIQSQKKLAAEKDKARMAAQEKARLARIKREKELNELARERQIEQQRLANLEVQKQKQHEQEIAKQEALEQQQQQLDKIQSLTKSATQLLAKDKLTISTIEQAHTIFNEIQSIDPENPVLEYGLARIVNTYGDLAEQALAKKEYDAAQTIVNKGLAIDATHSRLLKIRESINLSMEKGTKVFVTF